MPNLTPILTHRPDNIGLYASATDGFALQSLDFLDSTFGDFGATAVVPAGTTVTYNSKDLAGANQFIFSPDETGVYMFDFQCENKNINWNGGTNSYIKFNIFAIGPSSLYQNPLIIYPAQPVGVGVTPNSAGVVNLNANYQYSVIITVVAVGQNVDMSAMGPNTIRFSTYSVEPPTTP